MSILYIHLPFCNNKCPYCDFFSVPRLDSNIKDRYTDSLIMEFEHRKIELVDKLRTVYFGGGSPILLGSDNLIKLAKHIKYNFKDIEEITIEVNPEQIGNIHDFLELMLNIGINRVSIGVQTTNQRILKLIKRQLDEQKIKETIKLLRKNSIDTSIDMMFGLPSQSINDLEADLDSVIEQEPDHISFYMFTISESYEHYSICPSENIINDMFNKIHKRLSASGYTHYEVSNFCLPNKESKHNSAYWEYVSYTGLGAGAHSFLKDKRIRRWNKSDIGAYINDPISCYEVEDLDDDKIRREKIMLGLRLLKKGISEELLDTQVVKQLFDSGYIDRKNGRILINIKAVPIMDEIILKLS